MFKKILQSLSRSQAGKQQPAPVPAPQQSPPPAAAAHEPVSRPVVQPVAKGPAAPVPVSKKASKAVVTPAAGPGPEELCDIKPGMSDEQVNARLKLLYRRYNRSASSLDASTRGEADTMLDAIVRVREARFGGI
ncbi:MAG TPA: hypothetical protein VGE29_01610 [Prosthecobacter sp.]